MKKFILNILILVGIAGIGVLAAWFVKSCDGKEPARSPEETVTAFYDSMFRGDWDEACEFCIPTAEMKRYSGIFRETWEKAFRTDSASLSGACAILSEANMSLSDIVRKGKSLMNAVLTIDSGTGQVKTRMVEFERRGGKWLISRISAAE